MRSLTKARGLSMLDGALGFGWARDVANQAFGRRWIECGK